MVIDAAKVLFSYILISIQRVVHGISSPDMGWMLFNQFCIYGYVSCLGEVLVCGDNHWVFLKFYLYFCFYFYTNVEYVLIYTKNRDVSIKKKLDRYDVFTDILTLMGHSQMQILELKKSQPIQTSLPRETTSKI